MATLPIGPHRIEEMLKFCLDTAKQMLEAHGAFSPFGSAIDDSGKRLTVIGDAQIENAKTPDIYRTIQNGLRAQFFKEEIVAGAIVAEVTIPPELKPTHPGGLRIAIEAPGVSRLVFLPYRKTSSTAKPAGSSETIAEKATYEYGELLGLNVRPTIFVADTTT